MTAPQHHHPRKGNKAVEHRLHSVVDEVLHRCCLPGWRYTFMAASGWPTFVLVGPLRVCFLQLKIGGTVDGDLAAHIIHHGHGYGLAHNAADAVSMLKAWGCLPTDAEPVRL